MFSFRKIPVRKILRITSLFIAATVVFYSGLRLGQLSLAGDSFSGRKTAEEAEVDADFSVFWEAWQKIRDGHIYSSEVNDKEMMYGAISGILASLDDPYSVFMEPSDAKKFEEDLSGQFGGIGAEIGIKENQLVIVSPLKNSPAEKAGLKGGDIIKKVDNTPTDGMNLENAIKLIRGLASTKVTLLIARTEWPSAKEISITREIITVPTIDWKMKENGILHFQLYNFNQNVPFLMYQNMIPALFEGTKGIILDLRNNPGGFLEVAVNTAGWFLEKGDVVAKEQFRDGEERFFRAKGNEALLKIPTVVLVNEASASASEILAGALRDSRQIKIVGRKTFGKGTVQQMEILKDSSQIKLSIAQWLLSSGETIDKKGITPDYEVEITQEDFEAGRDPQLDKAMEILKSEISK